METTTNNTQPAVETRRVLEDVSKKGNNVAKMTRSTAKVAQTGKRQPLGADESAKTEMTVISDNIVKADYTFRLDGKSKDRYPITTEFDFSNCSRQELLELATASVRITTQAKLRAMGDGALNPNVYQKVDVKSDILDTTRREVDPIQSAIRALVRATGMTEEKARAMVEKELKK